MFVVGNVWLVGVDIWYTHDIDERHWNMCKVRLFCGGETNDEYKIFKNSPTTKHWLVGERNEFSRRCVMRV